MDGSINYAEYTVTQKAEGKFLKRKIKNHLIGCDEEERGCVP